MTTERPYLQAGRYYRDGLGDINGPMERRTKDCWINQHGAVYHGNGIQWNHRRQSAGNLIAEVSKP